MYVVGGANSAGQAVVHLSSYAASVTLLYRGSSLETGMSRYLIDEIESKPNVAVRLGTRVVGGAGEDRLARIELEDGSASNTDCSAVSSTSGESPRA